ncbi:predicted protein [Plenodomus lingam JN3]|uniref:Rhodopsin domain-containing protein n=1 Tax=Leptosphaeria maculans (strain JN3 / isolate v23.1.3 / race Av1-4-5-6-7-8) TaxID=985895 RepID=E4ZH12_LEPMJ|nr:predicted protein [Plenodomus lingam JN3]CBX90582.1 predicted protein [Plenodomus lingam JN3]
MPPRLHEIHVGAREATSRRSWIAPDKVSPEIAIVATLVSIALFSCLLRVCTRGRLLRTFAFDDGLALVAGLCSIGLLVTFIGQLRSGLEEGWQATRSSNDGATGPWALALSLFHIIGISLAKLSGAFYLLRIFDRRYCRFLLYGLIALILPSALTWFGSTLLRCIPLAAAWRHPSPPGSHCMSWEAFITFAVINNDLILVLILLPIACSPSINLKTKATIITIICIAFIACAAAILQTKTLFSNWQTGSLTEKNSLKSHLHRTIELTTALLVLNIPSLASLASTLHYIPAHQTTPPPPSLHSQQLTPTPPPKP